MRFNPRLTSAARRTLFDLFRLMLHKVSIRASLQQRGELICWIQSANKYVVSIRASLQQRGERKSSCEFSPLSHVSIRASLQQRGELNGYNLHACLTKFQSAPHFNSEANTVACTRISK